MDVNTEYTQIDCETKTMKMMQIFRILDSVKSELTLRKKEEIIQEDTLAQDAVQIGNKVEINEFYDELEEKKKEIARLIRQLNCLKRVS